MIVAIEGPDNAGKTIQTNMLEQLLNKKQIKTRTFSFPDYSTPLGQEIRKYLEGKRDFTPQAFHALLSANRWEKLHEIQHAAEENMVLIMNRYYPSNIIYGMARGLSKNWLAALDRGLPQADIIILLDVPVEISLSRRTGTDKFEGDTELMAKASGIYKQIAQDRHWRIIDATRSIYDVHDEILRIVGRKLGL